MKPNQSKFHTGEIAVQERLGVTEIAEKIASGFIRDAMPGQHRVFFSQLPSMILGFVDQTGYPWPVPIFGQPGFITSPNDTSLHIGALPRVQTILDLDLSVGQKVGGLGIDLTTRRRNRLNGFIQTIDNQGFVIKVDQSFGNCPQYIQARELRWITEQRSNEQFVSVESSQGLDQKYKAFLEQADTFFIATRTKEFNDDSRSGIDASHRGGKPGFIKVVGDKIIFPDYRGNRFYNTLGNIESDNRVGLLFPNFSNGNSVLISGTGKVIWNQADAGPFKGSERSVEIVTERTFFIPQLFELIGDMAVLSPSLRNTGTWGDK